MSAAEDVSNAAWGASPKPLFAAAAVNGVPAAVSFGGGAGLPDFPRDARGFGTAPFGTAAFAAGFADFLEAVALDLGARAMVKGNMARRARWINAGVWGCGGRTTWPRIARRLDAEGACCLLRPLRWN